MQPLIRAAPILVAALLSVSKGSLTTMTLGLSQTLAKDSPLQLVPVQNSADAQVLPQAPQLRGSLPVFTQNELQQVPPIVHSPPSPQGIPRSGARSGARSGIRSGARSLPTGTSAAA